MVIDTAKLRVSTKGLLGAAVTIGTLLQTQAVRDSLLKVAGSHPHVVGIVAALTAAAAILHNPEVQAALGVRETVTVQKETVALAPEATDAH